MVDAACEVRWLITALKAENGDGEDPFGDLDQNDEIETNKVVIDKDKKVFVFVCCHRLHNNHFPYVRKIMDEFKIDGLE